jgi:hypothetical protein
MRTRRYYAMSNPQGFANTSETLVFADRKSRDTYVNNVGHAKAITRRDATRYATNMNYNCEIKPNPFTGEFWGIDDYGDLPDNCLGRLSVCSASDDDYVERFY